MVKKVIQSCQRCTNLSAKPLPPAATAALPKCRVKSGHAFETVGVDFGGTSIALMGKRLSMPKQHYLHVLQLELFI